MNMNVLLTENSPGCGAALKRELEAQGHKVIWIIGAVEIGPDRIIGILPCPNPATELYGEESDADVTRTVVINLDEINFALCDARLVGPIRDGSAVVKQLVARGIVCCATSMAGNPTLQKAGAQLAICKMHCIRAMREGELSLEYAVAETESAARHLSWFEQLSHQDFQRARADGCRLPTGFPCIDNLK
jgi:hypothetical protein